MTVRVLLLCGSTQAASANRRALDVIGEFLERSAGGGVDRYDDIGAIPLFNPEHQDEPGDAVTDLLGRIEACDTVVIAAPEYAGALSGAAKNALDWVVGAGHLYGKPAVVLSTGTTGGTQARLDLIRTLSWQGAHVLGDLGIAAPRTKSDADGRFTDPGTIDALHAIAQLAADAPSFLAERRLALVRSTIAQAGLGDERIAPIA